MEAGHVLSVRLRYLRILKHNPQLWSGFLRFLQCVIVFHDESYHYKGMTPRMRKRVQQPLER